MSRPPFRFDKIEKLRSTIRDERQAAWQLACASERKLAEQLAQIESDMERVQQQECRRPAAGPLQVEDLLARHNYVEQLRARHAAIRQRHQEMLAELEQRRTALLDASNDIKVFEKLRKRRLLRHRREQSRQEVQRGDETAQRRATSERPI